ncbi:hypothetical protein BDR26DRAFT_922834 [Obelidium mucronatum]|nr:hypothetical protein BDR26DRAFT_922834 [Obelidium mucronatum]
MQINIQPPPESPSRVNSASKKPQTAPAAISRQRSVFYDAKVGGALGIPGAGAGGLLGGGATAGTRSVSVMRAASTISVTKSKLTRGHAEVFRPITLEDLNTALSVISSDGGKKITHSDIEAFLQQYFPTGIFHSKLAKVLISSNPKEDTITKEQLQSLLISKQCDFFEEAFQLVENGEKADLLSDAAIYRLLRCMDTKYGMPRRGDLAAIKATFDRDKDGALNKEDFKKMNMSIHRH